MRVEWLLVGAFAVAAMTVPAAARPVYQLVDEQRFEERFDTSDAVGHGGGYYECFTFEAKANQSITAEFGTFLDNKMLVQLRLYKDDQCFGYAIPVKPELSNEMEGSSHFVHRIPADGTYSIRARAPKGETGRFTMRIDIADNLYE